MAILRSIGALVLGVVVGSAVNMSLILLGPSLIPPPPGVDVNNTESLAAGIHLFEFRHFVFPFLAHALGTFAGALVAFLLSGRHKVIAASCVGALSLAGGIFASMIIPAPVTFIVIDLVFAYLPMAWLAVFAGGAIQRAPG